VITKLIWPLIATRTCKSDVNELNVRKLWNRDKRRRKCIKRVNHLVRTAVPILLYCVAGAFSHVPSLSLSET